jgi:hypothetical protein
LNYVDLALLEKARKAPELLHVIKIIKARQRKFGHLTEAEGLHLVAEHSGLVEHGYVHSVAITLQKQARKLYGLALGAALMEAAYEL